MAMISLCTHLLIRSIRPFASLPFMKRILIIGSCGAGKSTLARRLGKRLGLPVIHLDRHYWHPGWQATPDEAWRKVVSTLIQGEQWIIDGNYGGTFDIRFPAADTIIDLDYGTLLCLGRAFKRRLLYPSRGRPDMNDGCSEHLLDMAFYHYVLFFRKTGRPRIERAYQRFGDGKTILRFHKPSALERWLRTMDMPRGGER